MSAAEIKALAKTQKTHKKYIKRHTCNNCAALDVGVIRRNSDDDVFDVLLEIRLRNAHNLGRALDGECGVAFATNMIWTMRDRALNMGGMRWAMALT